MTTITRMNQNPSIYIPRVYANIDGKRIKGVFEDIFGEGNVARIDVVKPRAIEDGNERPKSKFNRVYVHFKRWPKEMHEFRQMLLDGGNVEVMYEEPWYWKCLLNNAVRPQEEQRSKVKPYVKMSPKAPDAPTKAPKPDDETSQANNLDPSDLSKKFEAIQVEEDKTDEAVEAEAD